ncbi:GIY-YIG nuclease family protein [Tenacibaculum xiamenense]|uniref:GIY-YIG nuclease family protein n=1 Tax=Tenacibaculum xiamenense TaxID=1261553 RepID=UPI0038931B28
MKKYMVYILECSDSTYYTGITSNLEKRILEHSRGLKIGSYTFTRRPVELVFYCEFTDVNLAIEKEKQIKKWSKAKKRALIDNKIELLPNLAKKKFN